MRSEQAAASDDSYRGQIEKPAWDELMAIPVRMRERLFTALENLEREPRPSGVVKLSGAKNLYRIRVGDYRIIYSIEDPIKIVLVEKVGHRRDVYR